jgi:hypothetical protein
MIRIIAIKQILIKNKFCFKYRLSAPLHISPSQKQKCFTFSLILISLQPLAVFIPMAFAFISSSLVKQRRLAGVSKRIRKSQKTNSKIQNKYKNRN